jgi:Fe2+ or Zn2+ uptake regulation protein
MDHDAAIEPAALLRGHGIQATAQRVAVLDAVAEQPHGTTDDVAALVLDRLGTVSRQAVYDALHLLTVRGLVRRIQPAGSVARYETRVGDNHHHVVCRTCGRMAEVDCAVHDTPGRIASDDQGFAIDEAEVVYWGQCPDCQTEGAGASVS